MRWWVRWMNVVNYLDVFESEFANCGDRRINFLRSPQQKVIYTKARLEDKINIGFIRDIYSDEKTMINNIIFLLTIGVLEWADEEYLKFIHQKTQDNKKLLVPANKKGDTLV